MAFPSRCIPLVLLIAALAPTTSSSAPAAEKKEPRPLVPEAFAGDASWKARQFIRADGKGNVFLLRVDTLEVYGVHGARLGEPVALQADGLEGAEISSAALSADGSAWLLGAVDRVLYFEDGKQHHLPSAGWVVSAVGMRRDTPVLGVVPVSFGQTPRDKSAPAPQVLELHDDAWRTLVEARSVPREHWKDGDSLNLLFAYNSVELASDARGRMWVAFPNLSRFARYTPSGRLERELRIGEGTAKFNDNRAEAQKTFEKKVKAEGYRTEGTQAGAFTFETTVHGMTATSDGALYVLLGSAKGSEHPRLARYDEVRQIFETVPLRLSYSGNVTMAAGRDALYLAAQNGSGGRWRLPWEALDQATWEKLKDAKLEAATSR